MRRLSFFLFGIFVLLFPLTVVLSSHREVVAEQIVDIAITDLGITLKLSAGSSATSYAISGNQVQVNSALGDTSTISSPEGYTLANDRGLTVSCVGTESKISIPENMVTTITPNTTLFCRASGGGSPVISPSPAPSPVAILPPPPPPSQVPSTDQPTVEVPELEKLSFKDVKPADEKFVIPLAELMLAQKTYAVPRSKRFGVKVATRGDFGLQIAAAVAELGCGSDEKFPGTKKCRYNAVKAGLIKRNFPRRALKKWEFLELLLKSRGIGLVNAQKTDLKKECPDVKRPTKRMAGVYFAAKLAGLPVKTGSKCRLKSTFSRKEAAKLGFAAMSMR